MTSIYDAALGYEIAFSYRDVAAEVDALLRWCGTEPTAVLEVAAGPAEHAIECVRRGMRATALDLSAAMCERAVANATAAGVTLHVINADMRDFETSYSVDLAFCMISSISHLLTLDDLVAHLTAVRASLNNDGCYVIEGSHPSDYLHKKTVKSEWSVERDGITVHLAWGNDTDAMNPVTQLTNVHVTMKVVDAHGSTATTESVERDRFWTATEMVAAARLAGLTVVAQYGDFDGRGLSDAGAWRMITVLRR
jgi:SAM-dependent methyltransferase